MLTIKSALVPGFSPRTRIEIVFASIVAVSSVPSDTEKLYKNAGLTFDFSPETIKGLMEFVQEEMEKEEEGKSREEEKLRGVSAVEEEEEEEEEGEPAIVINTPLEGETGIY